MGFTEDDQLEELCYEIIEKVFTGSFTPQIKSFGNYFRDKCKLVRVNAENAEV